MTTIRWRGVACVGLALLAGSLAGCWGIWESRDVEPSTAKSRLEFELVPNASLAKDEATEWQLGRYGFAAGPDRLLVISRVTSWSDRPTQSDAPPPKPKDRQAERVWITIPFGTKAGQELKVEDMESQFLVGYDAGEIGKLYYIYPSRVIGLVKIVEEKPNEAVVEIDVLVQPETEAWRVREVVTVPVAAKGVRATAASARAIPASRRAKPSTLAPVAPLAPGSAQPAPTRLAPSTHPAAANEGAGGGATLGERTVVGKWGSDTPGRQPLHVQFDADGRFAISTTGGAATPVPTKVGEYEVKGDQVQLRVDLHPADGGGPSSVVAWLQARWSGGNLIITGALPGTDAAGETVLKPVDFQSMPTRIMPNR